MPSGSGGADLAALTGSLLPTAMVSWQIGLGDAFLLGKPKTKNAKNLTFYEKWMEI